MNLHFDLIYNNLLVDRHLSILLPCTGLQWRPSIPAEGKQQGTAWKQVLKVMTLILRTPCLI